MDFVFDENKIKKALQEYCNSVNTLYKAGNVESSYNKPIIDLISLFGCNPVDFSGGRSSDAGENIDIKIWHLEENINDIPAFGAIEVKKVDGIDNRALSQIKSEAKIFGNVILTDNKVWHFYHENEDKMYNGFELLIKNDKGEYELDEEKIDLFIQSIKDYLLIEPKEIKSANKLAYYMAEHAKTIKVIVYGILQTNNPQKKMFNELYALYSKIKEELVTDLTIDKFADMYAQTITYGLFIARYNDNSLENFSRGEALENLSKESVLLKKFFQHITTSDCIHPTLNNSIDKLCNLFKICDLHKILDQYEKKDPIVHFYEDFLSNYDKEAKKNFGAYYTPVQVVRYIVSKVDDILVNDFKLEGGFSNNSTIDLKVPCNPYKDGKSWKTEKTVTVPQVAILDPACGTGTFMAEIIKLVKEKYFSNGNEVFYKKWIEDKNSLMSRLVGFEIMMTSYVVAHLKLRRVIQDTLGTIPDETIKTNIFLTNTLAKPKSIIETNEQLTFFDFSGAINDEAEQADKWKARRPIKVIIGNPPYLASSTNIYDISAYKFETDGITKLNEKNSKWLNDDYVKFIRFAEQHIEKDKKGVLAFISNNGYLDNPTFRGMRASLLRTFDKIYILNLHGNSIKQEKCADGTMDENVFDIRIGVSIIFAIKTTSNNSWGKVYYDEILGKREVKFQKLDNGIFDFKEIEIDTKTAVFIPQENENKVEYDKGISLTELFNLYSAGIVMGRDNLCAQNTKCGIEKIIEDFKIKNEDELRSKYDLGKDSRDWTVNGAIKEIEKNNGVISKVAYRIFDDRWTYYTGKSKGFHCMPRGEVMDNFANLENNIGICFTRTDKSQRPYSMVFVTDKITEACFLTTQTAGIATVCPLYIKSEGLLDKKTNFDIKTFDRLISNLNSKPTAEQVFDYCYGLLYDKKYREKYNELLKLDYPKVKIPDNDEEFNKYSNAGKKLRELHLFITSTDKQLSFNFNGEQNLKIEQVKYISGEIYINKTTSIVGVNEETWNYFIGGYQVIDKWLKSHKGEELTLDNFNYLKKIVGIIEETIKIQNEII